MTLLALSVGSLQGRHLPFPPGGLWEVTCSVLWAAVWPGNWGNLNAGM